MYITYDARELWFQCTDRKSHVTTTIPVWNDYIVAIVDESDATTPTYASKNEIVVQRMPCWTESMMSVSHCPREIDSFPYNWEQLLIAMSEYRCLKMAWTHCNVPELMLDYQHFLPMRATRKRCVLSSKFGREGEIPCILLKTLDLLKNALYHYTAR